MTNAYSLDDPLDSASHPHSWWSTTNAGEAMPGVPTPLGWSVWGPAADLAIRAGFHAMGVLEGSAMAPAQHEADRVLSIFAGRVAVRVDFLYEMGERLPGTSGAAIATQMLGFVPPGFLPKPSRRRYPFVAWGLPSTMLRTPSELRRARQRSEHWWRKSVGCGELDIPSARALFFQAVEQFNFNVRCQGIAVFCCIQPIFDLLARLVASVPGEFPGIMGGYGSHEETTNLVDLWAVSRARLPLHEFVARHGYHGPAEGEISARVWREDSTPLEATLRQYRNMPDAHDPVRVERSRIADRVAQEKRLLAALPAKRRPAARLILALARRYVPLRGVAKVSFLQSLDVARFAARALGDALAKKGAIETPEDVFYLTADELRADIPSLSRTRIATRRERRRHYESLEVPSSWQGRVQPHVAAGHAAKALVQGLGVSPGIAEGTVVVVEDPAIVDVEPGQILVARTTDPSWAAAMYVSGALVVDIGGMLSHAAVVARELGIPCVVGTQNGSRCLRTGDRCRVDGTTGRIEVLQCAR